MAPTAARGTRGPSGSPPTDRFAVQWLPLAEIHRYPGNPRRNDRTVAKVARLVRQYGWTQPLVVDRARVIIVGDTRYQAAERIGATHVPVYVADHLSAAQVQALRLADNRVHEDSEWDPDQLRTELEQLARSDLPLDFTAFDADEIARLLAKPAQIDPVEVDQADVPEKPEDPETQLGDRIRLGRHVLVCGDARDPKAWDRVLEGRRVDLVWTDPPYGVDYTGKTAKALKVRNDDLEEAALARLLRTSLGLAHAACKPGAVWYVACPHGPLFFPFASVLRELRVWRQTLLWIKDSLVLGHSDFHYKHEPVLAGQIAPLENPDLDAQTLVYGWAEGANHRRPEGRTWTTIWECPRPKASRLHPTMKPVELVARQIECSTTGADALVADPFGGSGTTLLAAEATGRSAVLLELDPGYCDVIVARYEEATGLRATREEEAHGTH